ncbi:diversity-generating retroelement protein Avd [bacterium]|nr:MAG: diversity-generating retroelement protein Avd [bacterium]
MDDFDIPIFKKTYDLYKTFYGYRTIIPKQDRYTIWQRSEDALLNLLQEILLASRMYKSEKIPALERANVNLNLLRVFLRLMKEVKTIDSKKYVVLESSTDEIGRMLGGWIKSTKER